MHKFLLSTTSLVFGAALALSVAGPASAGEIRDTIEKAAEDSKVALDWLEGKAASYGKNDVSYDGPVITLTSTSHVPAVSSLAKLQIKAWNNLERMSKGKIKVKASWSASVHSVREGRKAARTGLTDHAPCFSLYTARDYNMVGGLGLPFLFNNSHEAIATAEHLYPKYLKKEFEVYKVKIMREAHTSPYHLYNNKPVKTLADIKGMKIRAGGGTHAKIIAALGATQVSMPGADAYVALQRNTLDAIHFNDAAAEIFKLHEVAKFRSTNGFNVLTIEYCMGGNWFEALPADLQVVVNNWGRQMAIVEGIAFYDYGGQVAVAKMKESGLKLQTITLPESELKGWREAVSGVEATWVADTEKKGLPAKAFLADIKKLSAKYAAMSANDIMLDAINNPVQGMYDMK